MPYIELVPDTELVIKLPEEVYKSIAKGKNYISYQIYVEDAIKNGTPLPKGHGDLVDYRQLKINAREYGAYTEAALSHVKPKTIIEADKAENEVQEEL